MNRKISLIFALLISLLIFSNWYLFKSHSSSQMETAIVGRVIDGDTLVLEDGRTIRLLNINTPEKSEAGNELGANYLKSFENKSIQLNIKGIDKYQRTLARIYFENSEDYINLKLVELGYAKKFLVDEDELKEFSNAEKEAIENSLGIWSKSSYYGCFKADIDEEKEIVELTNICANISLSDWQIKDESRKTYVFKNINLNNNQNIILNSGEGWDNEKEIFWNQKTNVWNNDRDTLYLFDSESKIVLYSPYGY